MSNEELKAKLNDLVEHSKIIHSPEIWNRLPDEEKASITEKENIFLNALAKLLSEASAK